MRVAPVNNLISLGVALDLTVCSEAWSYVTTAAISNLLWSHIGTASIYNVHFNTTLEPIMAHQPSLSVAHKCNTKSESTKEPVFYPSEKIGIPQRNTGERIRFAQGLILANHHNHDTQKINL